MSVGTSDLDQSQIIQKIYDSSANAIQVSVVSGGGGGNNVNIYDSNGNPITTTSGSLNVNLTGGSLTVSNESKTFDASGNPISSTGGSLNVDVTNFPSTQAVSAATLPLPTGAATSANQATEIANLSTIVTNTGNIPTEGQKVSASSLPVVIASDQSSIPVSVSFPSEQNVNLNQLLGSAPSASNSLAVQLTNGSAYYDSRQIRALTSSDQITVASSALPTGASTSANQTTANTSLSAIQTSVANIPTQGQALASASLPVVLPASQITALTPPTSVTVTQATGTNLHAVIDSGSVTATISGTPNVSVTSSVLPTGAATSALQTSGNSSLTSIATNTANIPALGQALAAGSVPVVLTAAQLTTLTPLTSVTVTQATGTNLHTVVDSSALPTGAATSANQTTANSSLATIASNTTPVTLPATFYSGQKTSTGTAIAISTSQSLQNGVIVQAISTNLNSIFVGGSGVTSSTGFELQPGQATSIGVNNLNAVYIIATNSGDGVCYIGS